jgi:hypothetical protein
MLLLAEPIYISYVNMGMRLIGVVSDVEFICYPTKMNWLKRIKLYLLAVGVFIILDLNLIVIVDGTQYYLSSLFDHFGGVGLEII